MEHQFRSRREDFIRFSPFLRRNGEIPLSVWLRWPKITPSACGVSVWMSPGMPLPHRNEFLHWPFIVFPGGGLGGCAAHPQCPPAASFCGTLYTSALQAQLQRVEGSSLPDPELKSCSGLGVVIAHWPTSGEQSQGPFLCLGSHPNCMGLFRELPKPGSQCEARWRVPCAKEWSSCGLVSECLLLEVHPFFVNISWNPGGETKRAG